MAMDMGKAVDNMSFAESEDTPMTSTTKSADELAALNEALAAYEPQDILQYLIDQGRLPAETVLVEPGEEEEKEPGEEEMMAAEGAGAEAPMDLGSLNFASL